MCSFSFSSCAIYPSGFVHVDIFCLFFSSNIKIIHIIWQICEKSSDSLSCIISCLRIFSLYIYIVHIKVERRDERTSLRRFACVAMQFALSLI